MLSVTYTRMSPAVNALLPPESFQRWHHIVVKAFDAMVRLVAHLQGVGNGIEDAYSLLICSAFFIGIALATHGDVVRRWHSHNHRLCRRQVEPLVLLS